MRRPPLKAVESIANYCLNSECKDCPFGFENKEISEYTVCSLTSVEPYKWDNIVKSMRKNMLKETKKRCR